jgi:hypothetical protein
MMTPKRLDPGTCQRDLPNTSTGKPEPAGEQRNNVIPNRGQIKNKKGIGIQFGHKC